MPVTSVADIPAKVASVRAYFATQVTKSAAWRKQQVKLATHKKGSGTDSDAIGRCLLTLCCVFACLCQLRGCLRLMEENEAAITTALKSDVGKPTFESTFTEVVTVQTEIRATLDELDHWMKPTSYPTPASLLPGSSYVMRDPYGVVLIIAPFNYPIQLSMLPLIAAISAGNCAVLKPSELTPASSTLLATLLPKYLDPQAFQVITGAIPETTALLKERWDYIFFTGSDVVGKIVAKAAAEHMTPVTLELGGKSPVILGEDADLTLAARRVMWGKCLNAGQSCIAPDYVFVPRKLKAAFTAACVAQISLFYPNNSVATNPDFGRIVNERHTTRLAKVIDASKGDIVAGGKYDVASKFIEPTVVAATVDSPSMQEEIFGPILPIIEYDDVSTVIDYINSKHKPLALYIFSTNSSFQNRILSATSSGGVSINDVMMHFANAAMPFGGVGNSGVGAYHGKFGYETFSHAKAVLNKSVYGDAPARYPPYTAGNAKLFRFVSELYKVNSATFSKLFKFIVLPVSIIARHTTQQLGSRRRQERETRKANGDRGSWGVFALLCVRSSLCSWWWPSSRSVRASPSDSSQSSKRVTCCRSIPRSPRSVSRRSDRPIQAFPAASKRMPAELLAAPVLLRLFICVRPVRAAILPLPRPQKRSPKPKPFLIAPSECRSLCLLPAMNKLWRSVARDGARLCAAVSRLAQPSDDSCWPQCLRSCCVLAVESLVQSVPSFRAPPRPTCSFVGRSFLTLGPSLCSVRAWLRRVTPPPLLMSSVAKPAAAAAPAAATKDGQVSQLLKGQTQRSGAGSPTGGLTARSKAGSHAVEWS